MSYYDSVEATQRELFTVFDNIYGVESLLGSVLNVTTIVVCCTKSLRKIPSFIIILFISLSNITILLTTGLPYLVEYYTSVDFTSTNLIWCKLNLFFQIFSYNWSSWLLVKIKLSTFYFLVY